MDRINRLLCRWLGWHIPKPTAACKWDGLSLECVCRYCDRRILMDSNGDWFPVSPKYTVRDDE